MTVEISRRIAIVPTIATRPSAAGSSAASALPNSQISTSTVSGIAIASAIARSWVTWLLTW